MSSGARASLTADAANQHRRTKCCPCLARPRLTSRFHLAAAYVAEDRLDEALRLFERTLTDRERVLGPDHPDTLSARHYLAKAREWAGDRIDFDVHEQTLADHERVLGPDHPDTLMSRGDLAVAYYEADRLDLAIPLFERNLAETERILGPHHPETLPARNNLAVAYSRVGRYSKAVQLYEQALADYERVLGANHPHTARSLT